ncbi:MAG TPA: protein kinase [Bryobacteraceae bacterium]|nr:protein kinase [Bryobacteraceae bacterium]
MELGRGGFGKVYRAFDPTMGRLVAVKTLTAGGDPELLIRFRNEAASAGKLHHKNIVTIYDFGEQDGEPYIVMELLEGEDLQRVIAAHRHLSLVQKMRIMAEVAEGLQHAHSHGVVHRDVKPANIMVLPNRSVKIMDFGIALVTQAATTRLTKTGMVPGTLRYMAPEQFRGATNDPLSDIFAYATTYYELIAGQHPFEAPTQPAVMYRIMSVEPDPIPPVCPDCPEALDQILTRALHKERDMRYQSLDDMQLDIRPTLLDLQRHEAQHRLTEATKLVEDGQVDAAQSLVREVLELDPSNSEARQLRRVLQQESGRQMMGPKIEALLNTGRRRLFSRNYPEAISSFESAWRLDRSNSEIQTLLDEARTNLRKAEQARQLVSQGRQAFEKGNLTHAQKNVGDALEIDPTNPDASLLLEVIRDQLERRDREQRRNSQMKEIRNKIESGRIQEGVEALEALQNEFPDSSELQDLLTSARAELRVRTRAGAIKRALEASRGFLQIRQFEPARHALEEALALYPEDSQLSSAMQGVQEAKASYARQSAREDALAKIQSLAGDQRFPEAIQLIDRSMEAFGADTEVSRLRRTLEEKAEAQRRRGAAQKLLDRARRLIEMKQLEAALPLLQQALVLSPDDNEATALASKTQQDITGKRREEDREKTRLDAIWRIRQARSENRLQEALREIEAAVIESGPDETLTILREQIEREQERQLAIESIRAAWQENRTEEALEIIRQALERHPQDSEILELGRQVEADSEKKRKHDRVTKLVARSRELAAEKAYEKALELLDRGLQYYPNDADLLVTRDLVLTGKTSEDRRDGLIRASAALQEAHNQGRLEEALATLQTSRAQFGDEPALLDWERRIESDQVQLRRQREVSGAAAQVRKQLAAGDPDSALQHLDALLARYPEEWTLQALRRDVLEQSKRKKRLQAVGELHDLLKQAELSTDRKKRINLFREAERIAKPLAPDAEIAALLARIEKPASPGAAVPASVPSRWRRWMLAGGAVTILGVASFVIFERRSAPEVRPPPTTPKQEIPPARAEEQTPTPVVTDPPAPIPATKTEPAKAAKVADPVLLNLIPPGDIVWAYTRGETVNTTRAIAVQSSQPGALYEPSVISGRPWLSVRRQGLSTPGSVIVSIHPELLSVGEHRGSIQIEVPGQNAGQVTMAVQVRVNEPRPREEPKPGPAPPARIPPRPVTSCNTSAFGGANRGRVQWQGNLPANGRLEIGPNGVMEGGGRLTGTRWNDTIEISVDGVTPSEVRAEELPTQSNGCSSMVLINRGTSPVSFVEFSWRRK